jgi:hypothetical protein
MDISDSASNESSDSDLRTDLRTLEQHIEHMKNTANFLGHRLDTIQQLLDRETFDLEHLPIRINTKEKPKQVLELLECLALQEDSLELGQFLRALNRYLIREDLVDLNDLQIHLTPLLASAFQKAPELKKIPYALLLTTLPKMFV